MIPYRAGPGGWSVRMKTAEELEIFENKPVFQAVLKLALPTIAGQIILVLYNMADTYFIGLTHSDAKLSALTVCMPAFMILSAISNLFGVGGSATISRALGKNQPKRATDASCFAVWGCLITTLLYSLLVWINIDFFVNMLGGIHPETHEMAKIYLRYTVILGGIFTSLGTLFSHLVRSEGRSMEAGIGVMAGGILNIILDPLFMFVILPEGNETMGAGLATMLSNLATFTYLLIVMFHNRKQSVLSVRFPGFHLESKVVASVIAIGMPACVMTLFENVSYAVLDNLEAL